MQGWCLAWSLHTTPAVMQVSCHAASLDLPSVNYLADPGEPPSEGRRKPEASPTTEQKILRRGRVLTTWVVFITINTCVGNPFHMCLSMKYPKQDRCVIAG